MSVRGKKEGIIRLIGSFLILLSLILFIITKFYTFNILILYLVSFLIAIFPFLTSILLKLEQDFIVKYSRNVLLILMLMVALLNLITLPFFRWPSIIEFVLIECSDLLLLCCWHYSLSIYKNSKIIFVLSGVGFFVLNIILWISLTQILMINIFQMLTLYSGFFLIISAELIMKKKGLLNYV